MLPQWRFRVLDWLFGKANKMRDNSTRTQLYFRDDGKFCFRKLPVFKAALIIKKADIITDAWEHRYDNQLPFDGYAGISGDMVTISTARDTLYDPFNIVNKSEKPDPLKRGEAAQKYISGVANAAIREAQKQKPKGLLMDKLSMALAGAVVLFALAIFISKVM